MENTYQMVREMASENMDDPLCFKLATIFDWGLSMKSDSICMYRCSWEEDCNWYMNMDEDDLKDVEYETCAGQTVTMEEGCYDMGFCSSTGEGRDWLFWLWPYEEDSEWADEPMYYWIPQVYTEPWGCQLTYDIASQKNMEWEWDEWCSEEEIDSRTCQSLMLYPTMLSETSTWEIYLKFKIGVQGTNTAKNYYQFFKWDWEMYNMMEEEDYWNDDDMYDMECPSDDYYCEDWDDYYGEDWEMPSFEEMEAVFMEFNYQLT